MQRQAITKTCKQTTCNSWDSSMSNRFLRLWMYQTYIKVSRHLKILLVYKSVYWRAIPVIVSRIHFIWPCLHTVLMWDVRTICISVQCVTKCDFCCNTQTPKEEEHQSVHAESLQLTCSPDVQIHWIDRHVYNSIYIIIIYYIHRIRNFYGAYISTASRLLSWAAAKEIAGPPRLQDVS